MLTLLFFIETVSFHGGQLEKVDHPYGKLTYSSGFYRILDLDDTHALMLELLDAEEVPAGNENNQIFNRKASHLDLYFPSEVECQMGEESVCHSYSIVEEESRYLLIERDGDGRFLLSKEKSEHLREMLSKDISSDKALF